jgi:hypothetical protein
MWQWLLSVLAALSADPAQIDREAPRASAAVSAAYATTAVEKAPQPQPEPPKPSCCTDCGGKGYITHGDGHRTACPCPASCKCKNPPGASLTPVSPARPAGWR